MGTIHTVTKRNLRLGATLAACAFIITSCAKVTSDGRRRLAPAIAVNQGDALFAVPVKLTLSLAPITDELGQPLSCLDCTVVIRVTESTGKQLGTADHVWADGTENLIELTLAQSSKPANSLQLTGDEVNIDYEVTSTGCGKVGSGSMLTNLRNLIDKGGKTSQSLNLAGNLDSKPTAANSGAAAKSSAKPSSQQAKIDRFPIRAKGEGASCVSGSETTQSGGGDGSTSSVTSTSSSGGGSNTTSSSVSSTTGSTRTTGTGGQSNTTGSLNNTTGSLNNTTGSLTNTTGSLTNTTGSLTNTTGSLTNTTGSLTNTTGSLTNTTGSLTNTTGSLTNTTGSLTNTTGSLTNTTGSLTNTTGSFTNTTGSATNTTGSATNTTGSATNTTGTATNTTGTATNTTGTSDGSSGSSGGASFINEPTVDPTTGGGDELIWNAVQSQNAMPPAGSPIDAGMMNAAWAASAYLTSTTDKVSVFVDQSGTGAMFFLRETSTGSRYFKKVTFNPAVVGPEQPIVNWPAGAVMKAAGVSFDGNSDLIALVTGTNVSLHTVANYMSGAKMLSQVKSFGVVSSLNVDCVGFASYSGGYNFSVGLNPATLPSTMDSEVRTYANPSGSTPTYSFQTLQGRSVSSQFCGPISNSDVSAFMFKALPRPGAVGSAANYLLVTSAGQYPGTVNSSPNDFYPLSQWYRGNPGLPSANQGAGGAYEFASFGNNPELGANASYSLDAINVPDDLTLEAIWKGKVGAVSSFKKTMTDGSLKEIWILVSSAMPGAAVGYLGTGGGATVGDSSTTSSSTTTGGSNSSSTTGTVDNGGSSSSNTTGTVDNGGSTTTTTGTMDNGGSTTTGTTGTLDMGSSTSTTTGGTNNLGSSTTTTTGGTNKFGSSTTTTTGGTNRFGSSTSTTTGGTNNFMNTTTSSGGVGLPGF